MSEPKKGDPAAPVARVQRPAFGGGLLASQPAKQKGTILTNLMSLALHVVLLGALVQSTIGNELETEEDEITVMELTQELEAPPPPPPPPVDAPPPAQDLSLEFTVPDVIPAEIPPPGAVAITAENIYADMLAQAQDTTDNSSAVVAIGETPSFTPFTVAPTLRNRDEVGRALEREYPALLRDAGVGGRTIVWIRLDDQGEVQDVQVNTTSGQPSLDDAALRVARVMEFSPAMNRDKVVPVWVSIPIQFQVR
jgi:protein TonB